MNKDTQVAHQHTPEKVRNSYDFRIVACPPYGALDYRVKQAMEQLTKLHAEGFSIISTVGVGDEIVYTLRRYNGL